MAEKSSEDILNALRAGENVTSKDIIPDTSILNGRPVHEGASNIRHTNDSSPNGDGNNSEHGA